MPSFTPIVYFFLVDFGGVGGILVVVVVVVTGVKQSQLQVLRLLLKFDNMPVRYD